MPKYESFTGKAHPSGQFPVLTDGETVVVETSAIIEHLAVHHPGPAPLIPADPATAVVARMLDRVFDHYVMGNMQRVIAAYFVDKDDPGKRGMRDEPFAPRSRPERPGFAGLTAGSRGGCRRQRIAAARSLVTCAAAPALFYADWVEPIPAECPRLAALRAELLALPPVVRVRRGRAPLSRLLPARRARPRLTR